MLITSGLALTAFAEAPAPDDNEVITKTIVREENVDVLEDMGDEALDTQVHNNPWGVDIANFDDPRDNRDFIGDLLEPDEATWETYPTSNGLFRYGDSDDRAGENVLLVDDDDSDHTGAGQEWNNSGPWEWDTASLMDAALDDLSIAHDVHVVESGNNGPTFEELTNYTTVIWMMGFEFWSNYTLGRVDRDRLSSYISAGGNVWLIGNQLIRSIYGTGNYTLDADSFAYDYLGIESKREYTGLPGILNSTSNAITDGTEQYTTQVFFDDPVNDPALFSNVLNPRTGAFTVLQGDSEDYFGSSVDDGSLAVAYAASGRGKVFTMGIGFAAIADAADRSDLTDKVLSWMGYGTPSLDLATHRMMNWYTEVEEQHIEWTIIFNYLECGDFFGTGDQYGWGGLFFNTIAATTRPGVPITFTSHFENHAKTNYNNNIDVRFIVFDSEFNEVANYTESASVSPRKTGEVDGTYTPTRSGFYFVFTNISLAQDPVKTNDETGRMWRVAKWLDDLENGTDTDWTANGAWDLTDDEADANTGTHAWKFDKPRGTTTATGDMLYSPVIDLRWYNTTFSHPGAPGLNWIWFNFRFTGNIGGAGQDSIDLQFKASNMTGWSSLAKYDSNSATSDFSSGWFYYVYGMYMGDYFGQTVQFRWVFIKRSQTSTSWWAIDDMCLWMPEEKNVAPWFLEKDPEGEFIEVDVGTTLDISVWAWDPTEGEPYEYRWMENFVTIAGATGNSTQIVIPDDHTTGKYARGQILDVTVEARDDLVWNSTYWRFKLMDPKPVLGPDAPDPLMIEVEEDVPMDVDFGTSADPTWFKDPEGQGFTVTGDDSAFIDVTNGANNVLNFKNIQPDWNGWDNVTLHVTDDSTMHSMANFTLAVHVKPVNDAPTWKEVRLPDGEQGSYYSYNLTANDKDNDLGELTFTDDADFFDISASGEIAFVPTNDHVGDNYFNVTVTDPGELFDEMELVLFVVNVNDPPVLKYIEPQTAYEDEEFTLDISTYVEDPDLLLPPEYRDRMNYRDDTTKLDTNVETGLITWTPENDDVGELFFTVTVTDSKGRSDSKEVKITVMNTNDAPEIGIVGKQNLVQGRAYAFNIPVTDDDLELDDSDEVLTWTNDKQDLFTIDAAQGSISFTPENDDVGQWEVTITVTDSEGESDSRTIVFDIENVNDKPTIEYIAAKQLTEDVPFELQIEANDPDLEPRKLDGEPVDPDEVLTYRTNVSRVQIDSEGKLTFTPNNEDAQHTTMVVRITVSDSSSDTATADVTFTIENVNDAPEELQIIGLVANQKIKVGQKLALRGTATDIDNDADKLIYKWYAGSTLIGQTQDFAWKVKGKGLTEIKLIVSDGAGADALESSTSINVTIQEVDDGPGFGTVVTVLALAFVGIMAVEARRRRM
jgi:hypothetical protein